VVLLDRSEKIMQTIPGLLVVILLLSSSPSWADIYAWTDENGVRHFSDTPPQDSDKVSVHAEIPHDREKDRENREAYQQMLEQAAGEQQQREKRELEDRLKQTERQLQDAERKAEQALSAAKEARAIAEEKQRRREVYVLPWIGPRQQSHRPVPYRSNQNPYLPE
jgi:flagellar biosynthesis GTPase FlhF